MTQRYKSVFKYNKHNELITYVDVTHEGDLINYYHISGKELTKLNVCYYKENNKVYKDVNKAKIIFFEDCALHHMFEDGDSRVVAIKRNQNRFETPEVVSRIYSHNNECIEGFTINRDLIQEWLKKL